MPSQEDKKNYYVTVAGVLGCGKTTVSKLIAKKLGFHLFEENVSENKFLPLFYQDPHRWSFHSQLFYLRDKIAQMAKVGGLLANTSVVQDSPIYQDYLTYAKAQHHLGHMSGDEFELYEKIFHTFHANLPKPDLIIQLNASLPTIQERILRRGRDYEKKIDPAYISLLSDLQQKWVAETKDIPTLIVDTDATDLVSNPAHQLELMDKISGLLKQK